MTPQPLITVHDVEASSLWYQSVLGLQSRHGGAEYARLFHGERMVLQLHHWDAHEHPHLGNAKLKSRGNGCLLWFECEQVEVAYQRALAAQATERLLPTTSICSILMLSCPISTPIGSILARVNRIIGVAF